MNRILKRPMFRMGGSTGTGITSGLDRPGYKDAGTVQAALDTTQKSLTALDQFREKQSGFMPGALPGFLTQFGLNLLSETPRGNIFATAATAAKEPFQTFQASQLADREDQRRRAEDIFGTALASEYDLERERIENQGKGNEKTFAKEQAAGAVRAIYSTQIGAIENKRDQLDRENDPNYLEKIENFNQQISDLQDKQRDEIKSIYLSQKTQKEFLREVIIKLLQNNDPEDIAQYFPNFEEIMGGGFKVPEEKADGGRIGYKIGSEKPMMENVVEQKKETGEVQDLSYTELRTRLPREISNEIVMLLANSKQALLDFANIQTGEDIASFNQQYDVNLSLPQGA
jgi:hypothetical protein